MLSLTVGHPFTLRFRLADVLLGRQVPTPGEHIESERTASARSTASDALGPGIHDGQVARRRSCGRRHVLIGRPKRGLRRASCPAHRAFEALGSERSRGCRRADHDPLRCTAHGTEPCAQENPRDNGLTTNARESGETDGSPGADGRSKLAGHKSFQAITGYPRNLPVDSSGP
jgi:hypothetical protein